MFYSTIAHNLLIRACVEGGGTIHARTPFALDSIRGHYLIGGATRELTLRASSAWSLGLGVNSVYTRDVAAWLERVVNAGVACDAFGSWLNDETGLIHVDAVTFARSRDDAAALASERGELAFGYIDALGDYREFTRNDAGVYESNDEWRERVGFEFD